MIIIEIPKVEDIWDETNEEFTSSEAVVLHLEHSLYAISKWESKWCKPFVTSAKTEKQTPEEFLDYIRCMCVDDSVNPNVFRLLNQQHIDRISKYIEHPMSATKFTNKKDNGARSSLTSERIYSFMVLLGIPFECQYWHLNRLMNLIEICSEANEPEKKMSMKETISRMQAENARRCKQLNTRG